MLQLDSQILTFIQTLRTPTLDKAMLIVTELGGLPFVLFGLLAVNLFLAVKKFYGHFITLNISFGFGEIMVWCIKQLVHRPRPLVAGILTSNHNFSFPSGHAFTAVVFYGLLIYFLCQKIKNNLLRIIFIFIGISLILSIGFSRIYLAVHWPSDVLAGYLLGGVWVVGAVWLGKKYGQNR